MKKMSYRCKALLSLAGAVLLTGVLYIAAESPALSPTMQFRREEKANLLGPAVILGTESIRSTGFDRLIAADAGDGVILFSYNSGYYGSNQLVYREKTGNITVVAAPESEPFWVFTKNMDLNILVFDTYPEAVQAEIEFTLRAEGSIQNTPFDFEKEYLLKADRTNAGYFRFTYTASDPVMLGPEGAALQSFAEVSSSLRSGYLDDRIPVTVRLYDAGGNLIGQETVTILSIPAEAHEKQETD